MRADTRALIEAAFPRLEVPRIEQRRVDGFPYPPLDDSDVWRLVDRLGCPDAAAPFAQMVPGVVDAILIGLPVDQRERVRDDVHAMASAASLQRARQWRDGVRRMMFDGVRALYPQPEAAHAR